jgi:hypothetical protein
MISLEISSTHRIPFRPGQVDIFEVEMPDVGVIESLRVDGIDPAYLGKSFIFRLIKNSTENVIFCPIKITKTL